MYKALVNYILLFGNKSLREARTLAHMMSRILLILLLGFSSHAQLIHIEAEEPFLLTNTNMLNPAKAVWVELNGAEQVIISLPNGTTLTRLIPRGIDKPFYLIANNRLRYRPNSKPEAADTVSCSAQQPPTTDLLQKTDSVAQQIAAIKVLEFEYERTEAVLASITQPGYSCDDRLQLLQCLAYDASKAEVLTKVRDKVDAACFARLIETLPEVYQQQLNNKP